MSIERIAFTAISQQILQNLLAFFIYEREHYHTNKKRWLNLSHSLGTGCFAILTYTAHIVSSHLFIGIVRIGSYPSFVHFLTFNLAVIWAHLISNDWRRFHTFCPHRALSLTWPKVLSLSRGHLFIDAEFADANHFLLSWFTWTAANANVFPVATFFPALFPLYQVQEQHTWSLTPKFTLGETPHARVGGFVKNLR